MASGAGSKASDDEPLVPDDFDEDFFQNLVNKLPEVYYKLNFK